MKNKNEKRAKNTEGKVTILIRIMRCNFLDLQTMDETFVAYNVYVLFFFSVSVFSLSTIDDWPMT